MIILYAFEFEITSNEKIKFKNIIEILNSGNGIIYELKSNSLTKLQHFKVYVFNEGEAKNYVKQLKSIIDNEQI